MIKAHGRSRANAIKNAINLARQIAEGNICATIKKEEKMGKTVAVTDSTFDEISFEISQSGFG